MKIPKYLQYCFFTGEEIRKISKKENGEEYIEELENIKHTEILLAGGSRMVIAHSKNYTITSKDFKRLVDWHINFWSEDVKRMEQVLEIKKKRLSNTDNSDIVNKEHERIMRVGQYGKKASELLRQGIVGVIS